MALPGFLVIGAARAGTTTLYNDLSQHPEIYMPPLKEVGLLRYDDVLTEAGLEHYKDYFKKSRNSQLCGEASTSYAKVPEFKGVPYRAKSILGDDVKILYVIRDPIERIISHHRHIFALGWVNEDINVAIHEYPYLLDFSKYYMQISSWLKYFSIDNVRVIQFESYVKNRVLAMKELYEFLCVDSDFINKADFTAQYNSKNDVRVSGKWITRFIISRTYTQHIKSLIPTVIRTRMRNMVTTKPVLPGSTLSEASIEYITACLAEDRVCLNELLGLSDDQEIWLNPVSKINMQSARVRNDE